MLLFKFISVFFLLASVSGCGFRPLYSVNQKEKIISSFSKVHIKTMKNRTGQLLHNELERILHPKGPSFPTTHTLSAKLSEKTVSLGIKKSALSTRQNLTIAASFTLKANDGSYGIEKSSNKITVSYNKYNSAFATIVTEQNARNRAITEIAQEIKHHLGVFFKTNKPNLNEN